MAINFAGGTDRLQYGGAGWDFTPFAVSFWFKTTGITVNTALAAIWSTTSRGGWGMILNNTANKLSTFGYDATTARVTLVSTTTVNDGVWHHVLFNGNTANGGANSLYIDGASEATANSSAAWAIPSSGRPFTLGDNTDTFWASFSGDIAEIGVWNRQLDADEAKALGGGSSTCPVSPLRVATPSRVFYAPLVRDHRNRYDSTATLTGTTVSDHPRIAGGSI